METTARGDVPKHCITSRLSVFPRAPILSFCSGPAGCHRRLCTAFRHCTPRPVDLKANDAGSVADGIVLAIEDVADDETLTAIEQALERFGGTGTRVYAAIRAAQEGTEQARNRRSPAQGM